MLLLDAKNHHCFQPLLYQAATAALSVADIAWPIRYILARQQNATVLMATVDGVDADRRVVSTSAGDFGYDWLVLATGSTHSYFGHDAWEAYAPSLKTIEDALGLRSRMLGAFERAEAAATEEERKRCLVFAIVGGGATGVELAGALAELAHRTLPPEFRRARPASARILLLEAGPTLLPTFPAPLAAHAERRLIRMGVEVRTGAKVDDVREGALIVGGERIEVGGAILWAAGVRASPAASWLGAPADRSGRTRVAPDLSLPGRENVFVVGDTAFLLDANGREVPGLAAAAKQMGRYRRTDDSRALRRTSRPRRLSLSRLRKPRHHRPQFGGGQHRPARADGLCRLALLERRPHLFPDRTAFAAVRRDELGVELPDGPARRPRHPAAPASRAGGAKAGRCAGGNGAL